MKLVSFASEMSYDNALFYHQYFRDSHGFFVEASLFNDKGNWLTDLNDAKQHQSNPFISLFASSLSVEFYESIKYLFAILVDDAKNIFYEGN